MKTLIYVSIIGVVAYGIYAYTQNTELSDVEQSNSTGGLINTILGQITGSFQAS